MTKVEITAAAVVKRAKTGGRKPGVPNKPKVDGAPVPQDFLASIKSPYPAYRLVRTDQLIPYARNARTHSRESIKKIAASISEFGFTNPVLTDGKRGIVAGHGRVLAAKTLGLDVVPAIELSHLSAAQRQAYVLADNRLALDAGWDEELLASELGELSDLGFDLALTGFDERELAGFMGGAGDAASESGAGSLAAQFGIPPFTVLNAREGWWQSRKAAWLALGIQSEIGRGDTPSTSTSARAAPDAEPTYPRNRRPQAKRDPRRFADALGSRPRQRDTGGGANARR